MSKADKLYEAAFNKPRDARSPEYHAGVLAGIRHRLKETSRVQLPYEIGTAQADAWLAGIGEGYLIGWEHAKKHPGD